MEKLQYIFQNSGVHFFWRHCSTNTDIYTNANTHPDADAEKSNPIFNAPLGMVMLEKPSWKEEELFLGKNRLFNDWMMQEMAPHSLGRTTLIYKSVLPITIFFSMISILEKVINKTCSVLQCFQKMYTLEFWRICCNQAFRRFSFSRNCSSNYSVFRRSIPQNFEEYVVTAPWWKDFMRGALNSSSFFLSRQILAVHLGAVTTYTSKFWGILPLKTL